MKLIITEKPLSAKRIASILGEPTPLKKRGIECYSLDDTIIVPLKGHIKNVDFPKEYKSWGKTELSKLVVADLHYDVLQKSIAKVIEDFSKKCDDCIISTDYDREGESIGREAIDIVKSTNPNIPIKRAKFSALTPHDVKSAFSNLSEFDYHLADSADARREIDLIWGAVLTRYISLTSHRLGHSFLSAGRVQSPALAIVVSREKEIRAFKPEPFWVVFIVVDKDGDQFTAQHEEERIFDKERAEKIASLKADTSRITKIEERKIEQKPPIPFNTTGFLRAAANLGLQPSYALSLAESLYLGGYVSYPRTDNTVYSKSIDIKGLLKQFEKSKEFGKLAKKILAQKTIEPTRGPKEATDHPPIHPVEVVDKKKLSAQQWKVYELIVRRFFATLAPLSKIETMRVEFDYCGEKFLAHGKRVLDPGWREFYHYHKTEEVFLPKISEGEDLKVDKIDSKEDQTKPKPRYTPAALIKILDELGLGTKATRADILQKLSDRGYVQGHGNFTPSNIGVAVIDALEKYSPGITKPDMTADIEKEMDLVEQGARSKDEVVEKSRQLLSKVLEKLEANKGKIADELQVALYEDTVLGKCPECGGDLHIIHSRRGKRFVGCTGYEKGCKTSFPLPARGHIRNMNKDCETCGLPVIEVRYFRSRPFKMCINHKCESKADWGKRKKAKKKPAKKTVARKKPAPARKKEKK